MNLKEQKEQQRREKARSLRYKRPALASLGAEFIIGELEEIREACSDVHYYLDTDDDSLLAALDGDVEEEFEFKLAFAELEGKVEALAFSLSEIGWYECDGVEFDDCLVALVGDRYEVIGFDDVEEDYFSLCQYEENLAYTAAGERLMRLTKKEMLSRIGQTVGIAMAVLDLRQQYDYLRATMDILRGENQSFLRMVKEIEAAYAEAAAENFDPWFGSCQRLDQLLASLPERAWLE
jgi:hypothetical protein